MYHSAIYTILDNIAFPFPNNLCAHVVSDTMYDQPVESNIIILEQILL